MGTFRNALRKIIYVSGTRADFGLMLTVLKRLHADPDIDFSVCATAMHLSPNYGNTLKEIEAQGFRICGEIHVDLSSTRESMVKSIGQEILEMTKLFKAEKPDIVLLLGDRGEMLAGALVATHLNIHVVHVHGGERSGTIDEMVRHAISKFSHYHFVATENSRQRLIKMGEKAENIFVTGAPGLDGLKNGEIKNREALCESVNFDSKMPIALVVFHPVLQEMENIAEQAENMLKAALDQNLQLICLEPNADAGGLLIKEVLKKYVKFPAVRIFTHFPREIYLAWLANCDLMLGNSSSGIIEAASFDKTVVNIGSRQNLRERGENIIDCEPSRESIQNAIKIALDRRHLSYENIYGDGHAGERCYQYLKTLDLKRELLNKFNEY